MSDYTPQQLEFIVRFAHHEKTVTGQVGRVNDDTVAPLWGLDPAAYRLLLDSFALRARQAAVELLDEANFAAAFDRLPFRPQSVIAAVGDSITDDLQSWAEILRHALALRRSDDAIRLTNLAVSGDSTTHLMTRFLASVQLQPDWILCMIGTNDARMHGPPPFDTLVSITETERNLAALRRFAAAQARPRWAWITPAAVIEERIPAHWFLGPMQINWRNEDLRAVADVVRRLPGPVIDLQPIFGLPPDARLLLDDGLHPSLEGQKAILRALVAVLAKVS